MKKENIYKIYYLLSVVLFVFFIILLSVDYFNYNTTLNSAPFRYFLAVRLVEFLIPSLIMLAIGGVLKKKYKL